MANKKRAPQPQVYNRTQYPLEFIQALPLLGTTRMNWRQRDVDLYQHPDKPDHVISVGRAWDKSMIVIADEPKTLWTVALDYAARGTVYVSE